MVAEPFKTAVDATISLKENVQELSTTTHILYQQKQFAQLSQNLRWLNLHFDPKRAPFILGTTLGYKICCIQTIVKTKKINPTLTVMRADEKYNEIG